MGNSEANAAKWARFVADRPEFPAGARFLAAFNAGRITRLCDCGCNSFEFEVPENSSIPPLAEPGAYGAVFELAFKTEEANETLAFTVFASKNGHLAGLDVDYRANSVPVPDEPALVEPPYHVFFSNSLRT